MVSAPPPLHVGHPQTSAPRLPWSTQAHPSGEGAWRRWRLGAQELAPAGRGCRGGSSLGCECPPWWEPFLVLGRQGLARGKRAYSGGPTLCTSLNNEPKLLWWSRLPPQAFLVAELLTPVPSGCLLIGNSSPLTGSALQSPCSGTRSPSTPVDTHLRLGHAGLGTDHLCRSHSFMPDADHFLCSPLSP